MDYTRYACVACYVEFIGPGSSLYHRAVFIIGHLAFLYAQSMMQGLCVILRYICTETLTPLTLEKYNKDYWVALITWEKKFE